MKPILRQLLSLGFPKDDYALFGSGPLLVRGWIDEVGDLDVIARGPAWEHALRIGQLHRLETWGIDVVSIREAITVGTAWAIGDFSVDALIDDAELIDGIPCVELRHVISYKRLADRPKDREHLGVIQTHLSAEP